MHGALAHCHALNKPRTRATISQASQNLWPASLSPGPGILGCAEDWKRIIQTYWGEWLPFPEGKNKFGLV